MMNTDINIIKDCLNGNQLAYKQLYEKYISYCYGICTRYSVPQSDMKDVVQVIFSQVFRSLKNYDSEKSQFKTWLTRICINHISSYKRDKAKRGQTQDFDDFNEEIDKIYNENSVEDNIDKQYILSLLERMPDNYQMVFNMFIIDGYSHEEISKQLNITTASSRVTLNRARGWVKKNFVNHLNS